MRIRNGSPSSVHGGIAATLAVLAPRAAGCDDDHGTPAAPTVTAIAAAKATSTAAPAATSLREPTPTATSFRFSKMNITIGFRVPRLCIGVLLAAILAGLAGCGGSSGGNVIITPTPTATVIPAPTATSTPRRIGSSETVVCSNGSPKPPDQFKDLVVKSGVCTIPPGTWVFNNVNIYGTGTCPDQATCTPGILRFDDVVTDFSAKSILVENGGSLIAGLDPDNNLKPIGTNGGR